MESLAIPTSRSQIGLRKDPGSKRMEEMHVHIGDRQSLSIQQTQRPKRPQRLQREDQTSASTSQFGIWCQYDDSLYE